MFWPLFSFLTGFLISFDPATAIIGVLAVFILTLLYNKNGNKSRNAIFSFIGLTIGVTGGLAVYGKEKYISNWHSLWWIPLLWAIATLVEILIPKQDSSWEPKRGNNL
jgi:energy-coupling factor transporter transmembrane protein EcfT